MLKIIDISRGVFSSPVYPGDPEPQVKVLSRIGNESDCNLSAVKMCVHAGTHVDAPLHFIENAKTIGDYDVGVFIGPCTVIEVPPGVITGEDAERIIPKKCERLLIKGGGKAFFMDSSAEIVADSGVKLIGTDSLSVGCKGNQVKPHKAFLGGGVAVLEGLNLEDVEPGQYFLFAPPVNFEGLEGAPARAVLIEDFIFWSAPQTKK